MTSLADARLLATLQRGADVADRSLNWPADSWDALRDVGVLAWSAPVQFGGLARDAEHQLADMERLAGACLTSTFILSQREAAVRRVLASKNLDLATKVLPGVTRGDAFVSVGVSQLTTSRQRRGPALGVTAEARGYRLDGLIPWVTGADQAAAIVTGGRLADGRQLLVYLPVDLPGVTVGPAMDLSALRGSRTCEVRCDGVRVPDELVLAGPADQVLAGPGGGGLETSALALGLAGAAIDWLASQARECSELDGLGQRLEGRRTALRKRLAELSRRGPTADATLAVRVDCTRLALDATQVALTVAKGTGFVAPHPAGRWARQALFFLVWSCPRPVTEGLLAAFEQQGEP
jgi:alkylation response protein AidB-like acyl-CoA dehydrogenase